MYASKLFICKTQIKINHSDANPLQRLGFFFVVAYVQAQPQHILALPRMPARPCPLGCGWGVGSAFLGLVNQKALVGGELSG